MSTSFGTFSGFVQVTYITASHYKSFSYKVL